MLHYYHHHLRNTRLTTICDMNRQAGSDSWSVVIGIFSSFKSVCGAALMICIIRRLMKLEFLHEPLQCRINSVFVDDSELSVRVFVFNRDALRNMTRALYAKRMNKTPTCKTASVSKWFITKRITKRFNDATPWKARLCCSVPCFAVSVGSHITSDQRLLYTTYDVHH